MYFDQILSDSIEALAQGSSVEQCLARYPEHAEALAPLLRLVVTLHPQSQPRLSDHMFQQGRAALADAAQAAQHARGLSTPADSSSVARKAPSGRAIHRRFAPYRDLLEQAGARAGHPATHHVPSNGLPHAGTPQRIGGAHARTRRGQTTLPTSKHHRRRAAASVKSADAPNHHAHPHRLRQISTLILSLILILGSATLLRQISMSTPGSPLYSLKTINEQGQGLLMTAAGEGATWHANQMLRRVAELAQITAPDTQVADPTQATFTTTLAARVTSHVDQALAAGTRLSQADQRAFLLHWLTELETTKQTLRQAPNPSQEALTLLQETITQVTAATTALDAAVTEVPDDEVAATASTVSPEAPTALPTATAPATTTPRTERMSGPLDRQPTPTRVLRATAIPTATHTPERVQAPPVVPTPAPTATPLPVIIQVIPMELQQDDQTASEPSSDSNTPPPDRETGESEGEPDNEPVPVDEDETDADGSDLDHPAGTESDGTTELTDPDATMAPTLSMWTPTASAGEEAAATAIPATPTPRRPMPELTLLPSVEPDATIAAPALPTAAPPTVEPAPDGQATPTPIAPEQTTVVSDETAAPIVITAQAPVTAAPTDGDPVTPEEKPTRERQPTRTRRPTVTPTPNDRTAETSTPEGAAPTPAPPANATPAAEPTDNPIP